MAALSITLNEERLVTVGTEGFEVVNVGVSGNLLGPERATLSVTGGSEVQYLIWEAQRTLVPGDTVSVTFLAEGTTSRPGLTVEELYPDKEPLQKTPFAPIEEAVRELKQRPKAFDSLAFEVVEPDGTRVKGRTTSAEHGYAFTVLWNSRRPERARASAHTYTLDSLVTKENGHYHTETKLTFGQCVSFRVLAPNSTVETDARKSRARGSL